MNILFLSSVFPNPLNASNGCFNDSLVRALAIGHQVEVVSPIPWVDLLKGYRRGFRVPTYQRLADPAGFGIHYVPFLYTPKILRSRYGEFYWSSIAGTVQSLIRTHRPEVVIGYWAHPDGEAAVRIGRLVGAPSCVIIGGSDVLLLARKPSRRRRLQAVLEATDAVITVNDDLKGAVVRLGIRADKVHVWHQGIDVSRFRPGDRFLARQKLGIPVSARVIVWVGRMVPVKGLDILLRACVRLRTRDVDYHLYLIGDGPLQRELTAQTEVGGLFKHVTFVGPKLHDELADWYRAADLTVLPSRSEGLPNVLRESLACGTPFVASDVGGICEIGDESCSILVPSEDPEALCEAIQRGLSRWGLTGQPGFAPRFLSWSESAASLLRILKTSIPSPRLISPDPGSQVVSGLLPVRQLRRSSRFRRIVKKGMGAALPRRLFMTHGPANSEGVCLTFDDGPHPEYTPRLLDLLSRLGVPATFFVVGQEAERFPSIVRQIAEAGHVVGNHSFEHRDATFNSSGSFLAEVLRARTLLMELSGQEVDLFRPPHGRLTISMLWRLWRAGQRVVLWNVDSRDYATTGPDPIRDAFADRPWLAGDILLFHDNRPHCLAVLPDLIQETRARGLKFTTPDTWIS